MGEGAYLFVAGGIGITPILAMARAAQRAGAQWQLLDGVPDHRDMLLSESERARGDVMMLCVSRALTPTLTLDL